MKKVKISIYLPEDHPVIKRDSKERAPYAKELIEFALKYKESFDLMKEQLNRIEDLLKKGVIPVKQAESGEAKEAEIVLDETIDRAAQETLMNMMNMFATKK